MTSFALGISQFAEYNGDMDAEIGARARTRIEEVHSKRRQADIAAEIGMTPDSFSRSLSGRRAFTAVELVDLARALMTSSHWLVTGERDPFEVKYAGRHTFDHGVKTHNPIDWDVAKTRLDDVALVYVQAYGAEASEPSVFKELKASEVRQKLIEAGGPGFVRDLAENVEKALGVDVVRIDGVSGDFAIEVVGRRVIVVGETPNWFYENWSIAHELSHVFCDELSGLGDTACGDPAAERRANVFAAELLLPSSLLKQCHWEVATAVQVADLVWESGVSTDALRRRLTFLGTRLSPSATQALALKTQGLLRRHWFAPEGGDPIAERMQNAAARRFPAHLVEAHRAGVEKGVLGVESLAWMLGVDPESLSEELSPSTVDADVDWLARELGLSGQTP